MKKHLLTAIITTSLTFVFYVACMIMSAYAPKQQYGETVLFLCLQGCIAVCIYTLVMGIKGVRDASIRGNAIATMIVSSGGIMLGTLFSLYAFAYVGFVF